MNGEVNTKNVLLPCKTALFLTPKIDKTEVIMVTGKKKKDKITEIFFDEANPKISIRTYNTDLKNRLMRFLNEYPDECQLIDDSGDGMLEFEVSKGRLSFRLTAPYSEDRKQQLSQNASRNNHLPKKK